MGGLYEFLADLKQRGQAAGQFLGLLNILIGRRLQKEDGSPISSGVTWRELSVLLKKVRWEKEAVRDLGIDPAGLPPETGSVSGMPRSRRPRLIRLGQPQPATSWPRPCE